MRGLRFISLLLSIIVLSSGAWGQSAAQVLTYGQWKQLQLTEAKNRVVRISNQLTILKADPHSSGSDFLQLEAELRAAQQGVDALGGLSFEDYLTVYLRQFADNPPALQEAIRGLNHDEILKLLEVSLRSPTNS